MLFNTFTNNGKKKKESKHGSILHKKKIYFLDFGDKKNILL